VPGSTTARPEGPARAGGSGFTMPSNVSTAIVGDEIRVGIHVPVTGAAPLPTNWSDALDVVQSFTNDHQIHGRTVRFIVADDGYDPAKGLGACRKLADENVLFVIGHTMPTVQDECANFFNARGIPYLMRGTPETFLDDRPIAYFGTASDDLQARLLGEYALRNLGAKDKVSAVVTENDQPVSKREFVKAIEAGGGTIGAVENSTPRQPDFSSIIKKLQDATAQIVFLNIAPVDAIKIAVQAQGVGYHPTWIGEGTHWNYNLSMESAGMALDGAVVFSPWPSVDSAAANQYKAAFAKYAPKATPDDIGLIIWGWGMLARQALLDAGPKLSAASLVGALNHLDFNQPFWNPVSYSPADHSGPTTVAVFRGDGQAKRWRQVEGFRASF
jgi:branched-chain amino acid transport system substrate-binding protein